MRWLAILIAAMLMPALAAAQNLRSSVPSFGASKEEPVDTDNLKLSSSLVGFLEGAVPQGQAVLRMDGNFVNRSPYRAELYQAKPGSMAGPGLPRLESRIHLMEAMLYGEMPMVPWFSTFFEMPYRWLNPEQNDNLNGFGASRFGFRLVTWNDERFLASFFLRIEMPSAQKVGLGHEHWVIEPGLLATLKILENLQLEGEFRYWVPAGGTDVAGDALLYGLGLAWGQRKDSFWWIPVIEGKGITPMSGRNIVTSPPNGFLLEDAREQTSINGYLGCRFGMSTNVDFFLGYGRNLWGERNFRDFYRLEMRWMY